MGVQGLWPLVDPAAEVVALQEFSIMEGLQRKRRIFRVGVDIYALMAQCIAGAQSKGMHGPGPLRVLFFKLCTLSTSPILWVFVFDGPSRPKAKRGRKVIGLAPSWSGPCKLLLKAFGFVIHEAPGEAEAELAKLNELDVIDAVLTPDSDTLIFGAKCIIRSLSLSDRKKRNLHSEEAVVYSAESILHTAGVELTPGGLLLLALILGGDYDDGLQGIGPPIACGLARAGFGDRLLNAFQTTNDEGFEAFRRIWLQELKNELRTNSLGKLASRKPAATNRIPDKFPPRNLLDLYVRPLTSFSQSQIPPDFSQWKQPAVPQISQISAFCRTHLGWTEDVEMLRTFQTNLWEAVFLQILYSDHCRFDSMNGIISIPSLEVEVIESKKQQHRVQRVLRIVEWNRVTFATTAFISKTEVKLPEHPVLEKTCKVWVPRSVLPESMKDFKNTRERRLERPAIQKEGLANENSLSDSQDDEIVYLTTPPPPSRWQKHRRQIKLTMSKEVPQVQEIIDLTTPPPEDRRQIPLRRANPEVLRGQSPPSIKRSRTDLSRTSRVLEALDKM